MSESYVEVPRIDPAVIRLARQQVIEARRLYEDAKTARQRAADLLGVSEVNCARALETLEASRDLARRAGIAVDESAEDRVFSQDST